MATRYDPKITPASRYRGMLLYLLPLPLLPAAILALSKGQLMTVIGNGVGFALAMAAAVLARKGLQLEEESKLRKLKRRSGRQHYRLVAAVLLGIGTGIAALFGVGHSLIISILFGALAFLAFFLYYGLDPARQDPEVSAVGVTSEEVLEAIEEAERKIQAIDEARRSISNLELNDRLKRITQETRKILDIIEDDPRDLRRARKFLKVYLEGAQRVTVGYAKTHKNTASPQLEENFRRVLGTIEDVIKEQKEKLLENDVMDLDVRIEVLETQLRKEGIV